MLESATDDAIDIDDMNKLISEMTVVKRCMETVQALVNGLRSG